VYETGDRETGFIAGGETEAPNARIIGDGPDPQA